LVERSPDDHVDLEDRLGCQSGAVSSAGYGQALVQPVEVVRPQPSERDVTDSWVDVVLYEPGIAVSGGGPHRPSLLRQPRRRQELTESGRTAHRRRRPDAVGSHTDGDLLGLITVTAHRMPSTPLLARQGIDAVIVDDIETVFALHDVGHAPSVDHFEANPKISRGSPPTALWRWLNSGRG
jgi:hypothetical protein